MSRVVLLRIEGGGVSRLPAVLRKAVPVESEPTAKVTPRFSGSQIKQMGLKWVTAHPHGGDAEGVPLLVKDTGDDYVVVAGAGGSMNFTRFSKQKTSAGEYGPGGMKTKKAPKASAKERVREVLSEEEATKYEAAHQEAKQQKAELQARLREHVSKVMGAADIKMAPEKIVAVAQAAREEAARLGASKAEQENFVKQTVAAHEHERQRAAEEATEKGIGELEAQAGEEAVAGHKLQARVQVATGKEKAWRELSDEEFGHFKALAAEVANAAQQERTIRKVLQSGDEKAIRAIHLSYQPMTEQEQGRYFADKHLAQAKIETNAALVEATSNPGVSMSRHILQGSADAGAGLASVMTGTTVLDTDIAKELGIAGSSQVIARYLAEKTGSAKQAAANLRKHISAHSDATAAAAVKASQDLRSQAGLLLESAVGQGIMSSAQAGARALQYANEAQHILGRAVGQLETAAQVAVHLEQGAQGPVVVAGRGGETATRKKAEALGLTKGTYKVVRGEHGYQLQINEDGIRQLYHEKDIEQYHADAEVAEIKRRSRPSEDEQGHWQPGEGWQDELGNAWRAQGQNENVVLQPHQQGDIKFWERQKNVLITDEAGSGKTAVALCGIAHLAAQGKVKKALVVVPKTVLRQFGEGEAEKFLDPSLHDSVQALDSDSMNGTARAAAYQGDKLITVITHNTLRNDFKAIKDAGFDCLTVDETHYFAPTGTEAGAPGESSQRAARARELDVPYRCLMSGTPTRNSLSELYSLADWLQPGCLGTQREFMARYGKLALSKGSGMFDQGLVQGLQKRLSGVMMGVKLSVDKDEDGKPVIELAAGDKAAPPITGRENTVWVDLSPTQRKAYRDVEDTFREHKMTPKAWAARQDAHKTVDELGGQEVLDRGDRRRLTAAQKLLETKPKGQAFARNAVHEETVNDVEDPEKHPKVLALKQALSDHPGERAVVFAQNHYSQRTIIAGLGLKQGEYAIIIGDTASERRRQIAEALSDPTSNVKVVVASDAANFGLNMQGASTIVNYDASDTYATHAQRIARVLRRGQKHDVAIYNLRAAGTVDQTAQERIEKKKAYHTLAASLGTLDESGLASQLREGLGDKAPSAGPPVIREVGE